MKEPTTTLDSRFSDPNAVATDRKETRYILESAQLFWICTVRADGRPHVTPLVAIWLDGAVHFCTGATEQKAINLRSNPHVILLTGCNQWDKGIDAVFEGDAVQVTDNEALEPRQGVDHEMGWTMAIRGARWRFSSSRRHHGTRLCGQANQGVCIWQGCLRSDTPSVLKPTAGHLIP